MRFPAAISMIFFLSCPAWAGFNGTPNNIVKITGKIHGKREIHSLDTHIRARYIEIVK